MMEQAVIRIHPRDNVAVALRPLSAGEAVSVDGQAVPIREEIPFGHKVALTDLAEGEMVVKYGAPIGHAAQRAGRRVAAQPQPQDQSGGAAGLSICPGGGAEAGACGWSGHLPGLLPVGRPGWDAQRAVDHSHSLLREPDGEPHGRGGQTSGGSRRGTGSLPFPITPAAPSWGMTLRRPRSCCAIW